MVRGEVLPAYVERVRPQDGRLDVALRAIGGQAKAEALSVDILAALEANRGTLPVGDKSTPRHVAKYFPGHSKGAFKKAVALLYKQGKVQPGPDSI